MPRQFTLQVNGKAHAVTSDEDRLLLDVLREDLALTGTKYGCGEGECGACTVLIDRSAVRSCVTAVGSVGDKEIKTIEGLAHNGELHPAQRAFIEKQGLQCGYCVPGQILSAVALLDRKKNPSRKEIIEAMEGNICRCCNYANILASIEHAAKSQEHLAGGSNANR
jgi:aerobic-type carbon monoxide dehydrogenase small subunit (CoxS/CutS family)